MSDTPKSEAIVRAWENYRQVFLLYVAAGKEADFCHIQAMKAGMHLETMLIKMKKELVKEK